VCSGISGISDVYGDVPCLILVGGFGTRLRTILPEIPKPMAPVAGKPFLEYLIRWVARAGFRHVVLCAGYGARQISEHFGQGDALGVHLTYSVENEPLGTWGAIRLAAQGIDHPQFVVLNGDSWLQVDLCGLLDFHRQKGGVCSIAGIQVDNSSRFGSIYLDASGRVTEFSEKQTQGRTLVNGGVYAFSQTVLDVAPPITGFCSLEKEIFPALIPCGVYGMSIEGYFVDIGVPEEYKRLLRNARSWINALGIQRTVQG
jgi:D-glycero-alpha-D-manno-heptose 1-phosphate guanylyltransferase